MLPVKVNIYISFAPEDAPQLKKLLRWLYPMRDEVNMWYNSPPPAPPELALPWQLLLFWYNPPDMRLKYFQVLATRREKSHVYLFLTSYKSLSNSQIEGDIDVAVRRRIKGDDKFGPFIHPIILSPCLWKESSRLAGFKALIKGTPLNAFKNEDEGFLQITEELAAIIKVMQARLTELRYFQSRKVAPDEGLRALDPGSLPYLGESDGALEFHNVAPFNPPEWLGWSILFFIFISVISSLMPSRVLAPSRYENARPANDHGWEYLRENPMSPPRDTVPLPVE